MFGADSVVTPFPTSIGGQPPSPLSVQGPLRHLARRRTFSMEECAVAKTFALLGAMMNAGGMDGAQAHGCVYKFGTKPGARGAFEKFANDGSGRSWPRPASGKVCKSSSMG